MLKMLEENASFASSQISAVSTPTYGGQGEIFSILRVLEDTAHTFTSLIPLAKRGRARGAETESILSVRVQLGCKVVRLYGCNVVGSVML